MVSKKIKTLTALKSKLRKTLPEKISKVIQSYEDFLEQEIPEDAKGFSAHHSACKSAVVHAETLLKLARWTEDNVTKHKEEEISNDILGIIEEAKKDYDGVEDEY